MKRALVILVFICTSIVIQSGFIHAVEGQKKQVISLFNGKSQLTDKLGIFVLGEKKFIPIASFAKYLGIPIYSFPALGIAKGYVGEQETTFLLNTDAGYAYIKNKEVAVPEETVIVTSDDIYIESKTLLQLIPIKMKYNAKKTRLVITELSKLSSVQETDTKTKENNNPPEYSIKSVDKQSDLLGGISADYNVSLTRRFENHIETLDLPMELLVNGNVLSGNLFFSLSGDKSVYKFLDWNIGWQNDNARFLKDVKAGYIKPNAFPFIPMLGETGLVASNYVNEEANSLNFHTFTGNLLSGWEVELYRNGEYLGLVKPDRKGKYEFRQVPLEYGINEFQFKFYGPDGEKRIERKVINTAENMLKTDQARYRLGMNFANPSRGFSENQISLASERGLSDTFSVFAEVSQLNRAFSSGGYPGLNGTYVNVGASKRVGNFLTRNMLIQNNLLDQKPHLGWAFATENYYRLPSGSIALKGAVAKDFVYPDEGFVPGRFLSNQVEANTFYHITDDFSGSLRIKRTIYENKDEAIAKNLELYSSYFDMPAHLGYSLLSETIAGSKTKASSLDFALTKSLAGFRFSTNVDYDLQAKELSSLTAKLGKNYKGTYFEQGISEAKRDNSKYIWSRVSRNFNGLSFGLSYENEIFPQKTHSVIASVSSNGNLRYSPDEKFGWSAQHTFSQGFVSGIVFFDSNGNGISDAGEMGIKNADIFLDNVLYEKATNDAGQFFIGNIKPYEQHILTVREESLGGEAIVTAKGYQFSVSPGLGTNLSIPAIKGSQIDGQIYFSKGSKISPLDSINVFLLDFEGNPVKAAETGQNGSYQISGVHPGSYIISFDENQLRKLGYEPLQQKVELEIYNEKNEENIDFYFLPTAAATIDESIERDIEDTTIEQLPIKNANAAF